MSHNTLDLFLKEASSQFWYPYNGVQSAVMNGGFLTNYFNISRGVRQGCPLCPLLLILAAELLAIKIRQESNCRGISLPDDQEVKISQFADQITTLL